MAAKQKTITLGGCLVMLLATLLPLVNVKSYRWNILELPHKIDRLVDNATYNTIGKVLVAALVVCPLVVAVVAWLKGRASKPVAMLPLLVALLFVIVLFMLRGLAPGIGLWLYAVVAAVMLAMTFRK